MSIQLLPSGTPNPVSLKPRLVILRQVEFRDSGRFAIGIQGPRSFHART